MTSVASEPLFKVLPGRDAAGQHVFSVIVKRSYRITATGVVERCDADQPLRLIDEYWDGGDAESSTVQHESEVAPFKVATDVVVIGKAHAPKGVPVTQMRVGVQIGTSTKTLVVTGDRFCRYRQDALPIFTEPEPFVEMEVRYERAYGGRDEKSLPDIPFIYPRNGMGKGVVLRNTAEAVEGLPLPNIEVPQDMITPERLLIHEPDRWHLQPLPQGLGWRQRTWYPRSALLGSYPPFLDAGTVTMEEQMGLVPGDHIALAKQSRVAPMLAQFASGASFGLALPALQGDEPVALGGLTPDGLLRFRLPGERPRITLDIGRGEQELAVQLHTVSIRAEDREFDLVWRGAATYPGYEWLPKMTRLHAEVQ
jgi:hypothetical protein